MTSSLAMVVACVVLSAGTPRQEAGQEPPDLPSLEPTTTAMWDPGVAYRASTRSGVTYAWAMPKGLDRTTGQLTAAASNPAAGIDAGDTPDMVVVLHGSNLDHRWGPHVMSPGMLRPGTMLICPDGTSSAGGKARIFRESMEDAMSFRGFMLDISREFPAGRVLMYGHSQGGYFAAMFIGRFPALCDGGVVHGGGLWEMSPTRGGITTRPIVFMHGRNDPVVPYVRALQGVERLRESGSTLASVRRLPRYTDWPNPVRAGECLDWCAAMSTQRPREALALVERMLTPKPADEYEYTCAVWFGGARRVLSRLTGETPPPEAGEPSAGMGIVKVPDEVKARAIELAARIDTEGRKHVLTIRGELRSPGEIVLDGSPGAGHLVAMREDFRWTPSVDELLVQLTYGDVLASHRTEAMRIVRAWYGDAGTRETPGVDPAGDKDKYEITVDALPRAFLYDGLPHDLVPMMKRLHERAKELGVSADAMEKFENVLLYEQMMASGAARYDAIVAQWKGVK